ncbi:outer membrane protein assembly factor BamA [Spirochaetia bacterium]|nr:outer membrane protein assembly factor BamA [Spirochaetia bacterium]
MRVRLIIFLTMVLAVAAFAQESDEWYQGKPIRDIRFTGLKNITADELAHIVEPFIGLTFTDDVFWEIQTRLYALEYFDLITPRALPSDTAGSGVVIRFTVTERPVVSRLNFEGNKNVRSNELRDIVTLKQNDVVTQMKIRVDELAITNKYLEKGFPDVSVRSETSVGKDNSIVVTFFIEEGDKLTIGDIRFEGNAIFSARTLRGRLSLKTKGIINDGAFQEAKLIVDRESLVQYYRERGYLDASVVDVVRENRKDDKGNNVMTIIFRVYEGRIYRFSGISFEGNKIFSTEQLAAQVQSKPDEIANARKLEADLQRVASLYYDNGYIFNAINRVEQRNAEAGTISFTIAIIERGRAHIENILVRGNSKTKTDVILREIPLESGDVFSRDKVMDGVRNLYNLQYFSLVAPDTPQGSTENLMDLVIEVEEQPTTDIQFGMTFSGSADPEQFPVSLLLKWNDRNFLGYGNILGAEINAALDAQSLSLQYTHRWIFGLPLSGGFDFTIQRTTRQAAMANDHWWFNGNEDEAFPDGYYSFEEYENASTLPPKEFLMDYDQWRFSLGISTGYRWGTPLGNLGVSGGVRGGIILSHFDENLYRPFDPILRNENDTPTPATSFWFSVALDQRDIYYDPSKGYYGIQRFGFYGVLDLEQEHYMKTDTKVEWFATLLQIPFEKYTFKAVFGIHSGLSFIWPQFDRFNGDLQIERANMLSVDGMFNARGWTGEYSVKGMALWENWAEIRIPVVPGILAWDFFFDAAEIADLPGNVFGTDVRGPWVERLRFSFGGGLRFTMPQFPFRFSLAKRFKLSESGDVLWQPGPIWRTSDPQSGIDFVISFALSSY